MLFKDLGLIEPILQALHTEGYTTPTPIQEQSIPILLQRRDLLGCAQTGTGKTAAFAIPILQILHEEKQSGNAVKGIKALILTPTRELAIQIDESFAAYGKNLNLKHLVVFGGVSQQPQTNALRNGVDILIATPGRLLDLVEQRFINLSQIQLFVLDEADRMLDMGFYDDIMKIISFLPKKRQNLLFSATMPMKMREMARKILHNPVEINIAVSKPPEQIVQKAFVVYEPQKIPLVKDILRSKDFGSVIVFCSKKQNVKQLSSELKRARFSIEEIHSDLEQSQREQVLQDFRNKKLKILVATDILSRGIDIEDIDLVINYDVPNDGEDYIHRIGRTARAESEGTAYTFISEKEQQKFAQIEQLLGHAVTKAQVPEEFGPSPEYNPRAGRNGQGSRGQGARGQGGQGSRGQGSREQGPRQQGPGGQGGQGSRGQGSREQGARRQGPREQGSGRLGQADKPGSQS